MIVRCVGTGIGADSHIAIGQAHLLCHGPVCVTPSWIDEEQVADEVERFENAVQDAADQLRHVRQQIPQDTSAEIAEFIDSHLLMIEDRAISSGVIAHIRSHKATAEWALQQQRDSLVQIFEQMEDSYLRTRKDDLDHVVKRIHKILLEQHDDEVLSDLRGRVILAEDLSPADVVLLRNQKIAGFVTDFGGPMSHTAILARSLGIPAVVGARGASACLKHGEMLVLDTRHGCVIANCEQRLINHYQDQREYQHERTAILRSHRGEPALTADGTRIELLANIELIDDVESAAQNGADGIGLYRTEFLYMNRSDIPDEEEHYAAYCDVIAGLPDKPITIRTLDLGADKPLPGATLNHGANPALGLRAIRLCLKEPELFRPQLRAILRASAQGNVRLMLPMLTSIWEVDQVMAIIQRCQAELTAEGLPFDPQMPVGGMIEVPAAALAAEAFAERLDFLSIGTNDLVQYTLAIDRIDDEVNYLYDAHHPAVLALIEQVIQAAQKHQTPVSMCGEMAGQSASVPLLLGMGLRSLSMQPAALLDVKQQLHAIDITQSESAKL